MAPYPGRRFRAEVADFRGTELGVVFAADIEEFTSVDADEET